MFASRQRPPGRHRPGTQSSPKRRKQIIIGAALLLAVILLASSSGKSKAQRAAERRLADQTLEVQDLGGTQQVAIQQGSTKTVIQQEPDSSRPQLEVHDKDGVQVASKYKPIDTPGIEVTKGGTGNSDTVVNVGEGNAKQSIELLRSPEKAAKPFTNPSAAGVASKPLTNPSSADLAAALGNTQSHTSFDTVRGTDSVTNRNLPFSRGSGNIGAGKAAFRGGFPLQNKPDDSKATDSLADRQASDRVADSQDVTDITDSWKSSAISERFAFQEDDDQTKSPPSSIGGVSETVQPFKTAFAAAADEVQRFAPNKTEVTTNSQGGCSAGLPQLKLQQIWRPSGTGLDTDVTLVTQLTLDSLSMLQAQCELWAGPVAAVAYMPLLRGKVVSMDNATINGTDVEEQKANLGQFVADVNLAGPCRLTLEVLSEEVEDMQQASLVPFNALRNRALLIVKTEIVVVLDVEFLPPEELPRIFSVQTEYQSTLVFLYNNAVIVLPAFETTAGGIEGQDLAVKLAKGSKQKMTEAIVGRQARQYQVSENEKGQQATNYTEWLTSTAHYPATFEEGYEPYVIAARKYLPWYDERFRGHGRDRIVATYNMAGFLTFTVHPTAFVVQQPHAALPSTQLAKTSNHYTEMSQVYPRIQESIKAGRYDPVSQFTCKPDQTSTFASDLPTQAQVAEAAWASGKAAAGHLAALKSQATFVKADPSNGAAQALRKAQKDSADQQSKTSSAGNSTFADSASKSASDTRDGSSISQESYRTVIGGATGITGGASGVAGSSLGLSTGSSSAADPAALSSAASQQTNRLKQNTGAISDALKQSNDDMPDSLSSAGQTDRFKANNDGISERLDAVGSTGQQSLSSKGSSDKDFGDAGAQAVGNAGASKSVYGNGMGDLADVAHSTSSQDIANALGISAADQKAGAADVTSLGAGAGDKSLAEVSDLKKLGSASGSDAGDVYGVTDSAVYGTGTGGVDSSAFGLSDSSSTDADRSLTGVSNTGLSSYQQDSKGKDADIAGVKAASTDASASSSDTSLLQHQAAAKAQSVFSDAQDLANSVNADR